MTKEKLEPLNEALANYHNSKPANCSKCACNGVDCHPDDKEQYKWACDDYREE